MATEIFLSTFSGKSSLFHRQLLDFPDPFEYAIYRSYCLFCQTTINMTQEQVTSYVVQECYGDTSRNNIIDSLLFKILTTDRYDSAEVDLKILLVVVAENSLHFLSRIDYLLRTRLVDLLPSVMKVFFFILDKISTLNYLPNDYILVHLLRASLGTYSLRNRKLITEFSSSIALRVKRPSNLGAYLVVLLMILSLQYRDELVYSEIFLLLRGFIDFSLCDKRELIRFTILLGNDQNWSPVSREIINSASTSRTDPSHKVMAYTLPPSVEKDLLKILHKCSKNQLRFALNSLVERNLIATERNYLIPEMIRFMLLQPNFEEKEILFVAMLLQITQQIYVLAEAKLALFLDILLPDLRNNDFDCRQRALSVVNLLRELDKPLCESLEEFLTLYPNSKLQ